MANVKREKYSTIDDTGEESSNLCILLEKNQTAVPLNVTNRKENMIEPPMTRHADVDEIKVEHRVLENRQYDVQLDQTKRKNTFIEPLIFYESLSDQIVHQKQSENQVHSVPQECDLSQGKPIQQPNNNLLKRQYSSISEETPKKAANTLQTSLDYVCKICDTSYQSISAWNHHYSGHLSLQGYKCYECPYVTKEKCNLIMHYTVHRDYTVDISKKQNTPLYRCNYCYNVYKSMTDVINHTDRHKSENGFKCLKCPNIFLTKSTLKRHKAVHLNNMYQERNQTNTNSIYDGTFRLQADHQSNLDDIVTTETTEVYKCESTAKTSKELIFELYKCSFCNMEFKSKADAIDHSASHITSEGYKCFVCSRVFRENSNLKIHYRKCPKPTLEDELPIKPDLQKASKSNA